MPQTDPGEQQMETGGYGSQVILVFFTPPPPLILLCQLRARYTISFCLGAPDPGQLKGVLDYRSDWGTFRERLNAYESNIDEEANQRKKKSVKKKKHVLKKLKFRSSEDASKKYFEQKIHFNSIANPLKLELYREKIKTVKLVRLSWQNGGPEPIIKTQELPSSSNSSSQSLDTE